jgi:hypothetical protein
VLGVLLALALGAALALWLLATAFPSRAVGGDGAGGAAEAPAAVETVGPATVVATSSCLAEDPRDTVVVDGPAGRRLMALDACGTPVATRVTVRMAFVGTEPAATPARLAGTGSSAPLAAAGPAESPLTDRFAVLLTGVAALGMGGLLVAVVRERSRRAARPAPARRPARPVTTVSSPGREPRRAPHRPSARPGRSTRAGRPSALEAGRRQQGARGRTTPRRPAAGPHRG